jgi:cytochrome c5
MSDPTPHDSAEAQEGHEGPIKTPKQLMAAVAASFLVPIVAIVLLINYVAEGDKPAAGSDAFSEKSTLARIQPLGSVVVRDASDLASLKSGEQVYQAVCTACHGAGLAGAPKTGDAAAWAPRLATGYETLLNSALKGKGAMGAQGGGDFADLEIARAVVWLANRSGGKFEEPKAPAPAASAAN